MIKRYSTWLNALAGMMAAAMVYVPELGCSSEVTAGIMLACSVVIAASQSVKQGAKK